MRSLFIFIILAIFLSSCQTKKSHELPKDVIDYKIPSIAVLDFENKAPFFKGWKLGSGFREVLVDELVKSRRYNVITRNDINAVLAELSLQDSKLFRKQGKVKKGNLQNVQYLIRGVISDFGHVKGSSFRTITSSFGIGGDGSIAQVSVTMHVIEVETGKILASTTLDGQASAGQLQIKGQYDNVAFGGSSFYRTPLGKATAEVMKKCINEISTVIAHDKWHPRVVKVLGDKLYISGGLDRAVKVGYSYQAFEAGEQLLDPDTGDVLGSEQGSYFGKVEVVDVKDKYSIVRVVDGKFKVGDTLHQILPSK